jgi:glyoxylase-like metal-dependent hydrolase (beta-lactamase superfamily II)
LLTTAQATGPSLPKVGFADGDLAKFQPVNVDQSTLVAPGIVLLPAPGHSAGTQLIYVRLQDGRELMFIGDIAWHADAIRYLVGRPYLVSRFMLQEDRQAVVDQLAALKPLLDAGTPTLIVAHDAEQYQQLQRAGLVHAGLVLH